MTPTYERGQVTTDPLEQAFNVVAYHEQLVLGALYELAATGRPGEACRELCEARIGVQRERARKAGSRWLLIGDSARRRDGVTVFLAGAGHIMRAQESGLPCALGRSLEADEAPWVVEVPERSPAGLKPFELVDAPNILEAMEQIDRRWPMPDWHQAFGEKRP